MVHIDPIAMIPPVAYRYDLVDYGDDLVDSGRSVGCRAIRRFRFLAM